MPSDQKWLGQLAVLCESITSDPDAALVKQDHEEPLIKQLQAMADGATSTISLRGSVDLVQEFFEYAINSILYQRGIYPPEEFRRVAKYGLSMMVASDDGLQTYLKKILAQLKTWLEEGDVQRLVVVVTCVEINQCVGCTR